jgi:hypothetical protein
MASFLSASSSSDNTWKRIRNEEKQNTDIIITLPNELWIRAFTYLDQNDLFSIANVNRNFLSTSSDDLLWKVICHRRWSNKKINVSRFARRDGGGGELNDGRVKYCATLLRHFTPYWSARKTNIVYWDRIPPLNINESVRHEPKSWKESYIMAEIDSRRTVISRLELIQFRWQLIYDGSPSTMGLRQFNEDGTYLSPYLGMSEWVLRGNMLTFAGMELVVEKDKRTWGWIIGKGQRTVYYSVEVDERNTK